MSGSRSRPAVLLAVCLAVALVLFAQAPLLRAGLFGWDRAALERATWSARTFSAEPWSVRLIGLLLLVGVALAARAFLARLLEPWLGAHPARAAALVTALLVPLHFASPSAIAEIAGRGETLALFLGLVAGAMFLRGRQAERVAWTVASLVLLVAAGFASRVAILLAALFAAAEFASARRHRRTTLRVRTAATTAAVFGAGAWLPAFLLVSRLPAAADEASLPFAEELRERLLAVIEELGRLAAPGGVALGTLGTLLAGALLLFALQPVFRAARQAPRLWGVVLLCWSAVLAGSLLWASTAGSGRALLAIVVWSAGLGLSITAHARPARAALVVVMAFGWAVLAHASARPWGVGARALAQLQADVMALPPPPAAHLYVLDPPVVAGVPPLATDFDRLFPELPEVTHVQALTRAAFLVLLDSDAFERFRAEGIAVALADGAHGLRAVELAPSRAARGPQRAWRGDLTYTPDEPLDPLEIGLVRIVAELSTAPEDLALLAWRSRGGELGSAPGVQAERGGRRIAEFDLARSLEWRLAGSVRSLLVEKGKRPIESGEILARLPEVPALAGPVAEGSDWLFTRSGGGDTSTAGGHTVLQVLDLDALELVEIPLEPDAGGLRARGAQRFVARAAAPVAWSVEYRRGEHALSRSRGTIR